ncbi:MAG: Xaa-Pro aminopeptidase [Ignavibacteria bacterium RBG_13_36_8]|nr:MAG: Xaa-Pro aminopeptidase [Ignavibacteria bacterium RBG_13_36_8]
MIILEKVNQAKKILKEFDVDCWITFVRETSIQHDPALDFLIQGHVTWHSAFIISSSGKTKAIVGQYDKQSIEDLKAYDDVEAFVEGIKKPLTNYLKELNPAKIGINFSKGSEICDGITYGMYLTLFEYLEGLGMQDRLVSSEKIVSALRERKTKTEIDYIKKAIKHTEQIFDRVSKFIKPGLTEIKIAKFMREEVKQSGLGFAWEEEWNPAVFTGPDTAGAHYMPTERKVEKGHVLNMDFGMKFKGYCSDMQRTFYILKDGEPHAPEEVMKGFNTIVKAIDESKKAMKPGIQAFEIDAIARRIVTENGYAAFPHGLGHQVGRYAHDGTALLGPKWEKYAQKPFQLLEEGMVFTLEPRLTVPDYGVATIEEMVVVTKNGSEWLSHPQKEIILIK